MATLELAVGAATDAGGARARADEERELPSGVARLEGLTCKGPCDTAREPRAKLPKVLLEEAGIRAEPPVGTSCWHGKPQNTGASASLRALASQGLPQALVGLAGSGCPCGTEQDPPPSPRRTSRAASDTAGLADLQRSWAIEGPAANT